MTEFEALVSLNLTGNIGAQRLKKLLEYFDKPQNILNASKDRLMNVCGIGEVTAARISSLGQDDLDNELRSAKKQGLNILTQQSPDYPLNLKHIFDPPIILYVKGQLKPEDNLGIGIVGSRRASFYGLSNAGKFASELVSRGFTVVSGMARGIDTASHRGALKAGGRTIAVIGSGFNYLYPEENKALAEEIAANGAVLSEFAMDMQPFRQNFPCRNRIISGLSLGVLVVEAARNSGALITADFALEQGREVFAVPGKVDSSNSSGTNGLIKQGAKLVSCVDDITQEFDLPHLSGNNIPAAADTDTLEERPVFQEQDIYALLADRPAGFDELVEKTNMDISRISDILLKLQMKKLIKRLPGNNFARSLA